MLLQAAASGSVFISFSVLAQAYSGEFNPDRTVLMMALTAVIVGNGILGPMLGRALERWSIKYMMMLGVVMLGVGFVAVARAESMLHVVLVYLVFMSFAATLGGPIAGAALLSRWFTKRRGLAMSLSAGGAAIGGLLAPPLLQWLMASVGWRDALIGYGVGIMVVVLPVLAWLIIDRPDRVGQFPDGASEVSERMGKSQPSRSWSFYLADSNFWLLSVTLGILFSCSMGVTSSLLQSVGERGINAEQGAYLLSIFSTLNFVGKILSGGMADRYSPKLIFAAIIGVFGIAVFGLAHFGAYGLLVLSSVLLGVSQGAIVPLWSVLMARLYGAENVGGSMGMMSTLLMPFNFMAPPLFGLAFDKTGSYYPAFIVCLIGLAIAFVLQAYIKDSEQPTAH